MWKSTMANMCLAPTFMLLFCCDPCVCFQSMMRIPCASLKHSSLGLRQRLHIVAIPKSVRRLPHITGLKASFVPPTDGKNFANQPDHPVLKDPIVLQDRTTKETVSIRQNGAQIVSYKTPEYDVLAIRPDAVLDGTKPISGGIPICFPQFGPGPLPQHGFVRNLKWNCLDAREEYASGKKGFSYSRDNARAVFELIDTKETREIWPQRFRCQYVVDLSAGCLKIDFRVINFADTPLTFTAALHTYFAVDDIDQIRIVGDFAGKEYLDKALNPPATKVEDRSELNINGFTERVYVKAPERVELVDGAKSVIMKSQTWEDLVIWNPYGKEEMGYRNFVCIEHGCVNTPVVVGPSELWSAVVEIRPYRDGSPAWLLPSQDDA